MLLLEGEVLIVQSVDSVNHGLDELNLGVTKTMFVGDVISDASLTTRFTAGTTGLESELFAPLLQSGETLLGPSGEVNVDRGAHTGAQVGGARVEVSIDRVEHEFASRFGLDRLSDSIDTAGKTVEDTLDITALLHGDDTELILLIDPDEEGLGRVVEDTTTLGPFTLHTSGDKVLVAGDEEEMVVDELLTVGLSHSLQGEVFSSEVELQLSEGGLHELFDVLTLLAGDSGGETESIDGAADADPGGLDGSLLVDVANNLGRVHVGLVAEAILQSVVFQDEGVENVVEIGVRVGVAGVDAAVLVVELDGASNGLGEGKAGGLCLDAAEFGPLFGGDVFRDQGVSGGDFGHSSSLTRLLSSDLVQDDQTANGAQSGGGDVELALLGDRVEESVGVGHFGNEFSHDPSSQKFEERISSQSSTAAKMES